MPAESFGSHIVGGGAISSGAYRIPAISSAWSAKDKGGRCGGASGCVRAARSVAVRSSRDSVSIKNQNPIVRQTTWKVSLGAHLKGQLRALAEGSALLPASKTSFLTLTP